MALTLEQAAAVAAELHTAAETALARDGRFTGTIALIQPDARASGVLPFGPDGTPPSEAFIVGHAARQGAAGLVLTGEYWVDLAPLTRQQAARGLSDLPRPSDAPVARRDEQIITTVVVRGQSHVLRLCTPVRRTAFGVSLGERVEINDDPVMPDGEAQRLIAMLERASKST